MLLRGPGLSGYHRCMTDWRRQSPAQKRRMGAPSSVYGGVDPVIEDSMAVGLAGMSSTGSPRQPMDRSALRDMVNASADYTSGATLHPRFYAPASDPAFFPVARPNPVQNENGGARYGLRVSIPVPVSIEASSTQANGRLIRGRGTGGSFAGGASA